MPSNKWQLFVISLLLSFGTYAALVRLSEINEKVPEQSQVVAAEMIQTDRKTGYKTYRNQLFTGEVVTYYPSMNATTNEKLKQKTSYQNGVKHGQSLQYYDDGALAYIAYYDRGKLNGPTISLWSNGILRFIVLYEQGKTQGVARQWYVSGKLYKQMNYVNGLETGLQQAWRKNGKLYANYENVNGRIFGLKKANLCFGLEDETLTF